MLTPLQTKKFTRAFHVWDADKNGLVERGDFDAIVANLGAIRGLGEGSADLADLRGRYLEHWAMLERLLTAGQTGASLEHWLSFLDSIVSDEKVYQQAIPSLADFVFDVLDGNKDGVVSRDEFAAFYRAYRVDQGIVDELFSRLGKTATDTLSKTEVQRLVQDFYFSEDPASAGNFLYGALD